MHIDRLQCNFDPLLLPHFINIIVLRITLAEDNEPLLQFTFSSTYRTCHRQLLTDA
jgi:hypothetical protein